ncbi:MAG: pilus assembly protein N-terminal domain-containing protein [bacterium]
MPRRDRRTGVLGGRRLATRLAVALVSGVLVAGVPAPETVRIPVGQSVSLPLGSPVSKISDADSSVVGYFLNSADQIEIVGRGTGSSPLRVRLADGSSRLFQVDVVPPGAVPAEPEPIVASAATAAATPEAAPLAVSAAASPADDASELELGVGETQSFDVTGTATRIDVGTAGIVDVERNHPGEVTLVGRAPGRTDITLTGSGGVTSRYSVRVVSRGGAEPSDVLSVTEVPPVSAASAEEALPEPPAERVADLPPPPAPAYPPESEIGPLPANLNAPPPEFVTPEKIGELKKSIDELRGQIAARPSAAAPPPPASSIQPAQLKQAVREVLAESAPPREQVWRPAPRGAAPTPAPATSLDVHPEGREPLAPRAEPAARPAAETPRPAPQPKPPELRPIVRLAELSDGLLSLGVGRSRVLVLDSPAKRVAVANPDVGDVVMATPSQLVVNGKSNGTTDLVIWDQNDRGTQVKVRVEAQGSTEKQVLLKCKVAEVQRQAMRELGIDAAVLLDSNVVKGGLGVVTRGGGVLPGVVPGTPSGDVLGSSGQLPENADLTIFQPDRGIFAFLKALEKRGVARILAEPNLVAINGQEAHFLAGGEVPIPMVTSVQTGELPRVTVDYKEFGVKLNFRPTILDDETISLHVMPEVSSLDFSNGVVLSDFKIPALDTRRAETTIQLRDGQSIVIAGLMMTRKEQGESKVPWLGDVPFFGNLFRNDDGQNTETELVILLTARIVRPLPAGSTPTLAFDRVETH